MWFSRHPDSQTGATSGSKMFSHWCCIFLTIRVKPRTLSLFIQTSPSSLGRAIIRRPVRGVPDVDSFLHSLVDFLYGDVPHGEDVDVFDVRFQDVPPSLSRKRSRGLSPLASGLINRSAVIPRDRQHIDTKQNWDWYRNRDQNNGRK